MTFAELGTCRIFFSASRVSASCCLIKTSPWFFLTLCPRVIAVSRRASVNKKFCVKNVQLLKFLSMPIRTHSLLPPLLAVNLHPSTWLLVFQRERGKVKRVGDEEGRQETVEYRQETGSGDGRQETGDERQETWDGRQETEDRRRDTADFIWFLMILCSF